MPKRQELIALIESGRHLLVGAKALAAHVRPRFTADTDYIVSAPVFQRIRKWARQACVTHNDAGFVIRFEPLAVDVIDARGNAGFKEVLRRESGTPSPEALAAAKYVAIVSQDRGHRRFQDVSDFSELVLLPVFDLEKLRCYLVEPYAEQWPRVEQLISDIKASRPVTI